LPARVGAESLLQTILHVDACKLTSSIVGMASWSRSIPITHYFRVRPTELAIGARGAAELAAKLARCERQAARHHPLRGDVGLPQRHLDPQPIHQRAQRQREFL